MPVRRMRQFLDEHEVRYVTLNHSPAYTAQAVAASAHIPSGQMAKVVMIRVDGKPAMAVLPASFQVDFDELRDGLHGSEVVLMSENEFKNQFPDCKQERCLPSAISMACRSMSRSVWPRTNVLPSTPERTAKSC